MSDQPNRVIVWLFMSGFMFTACAPASRPQVLLPTTIPNVSEYAAKLRITVRKADRAEYFPIRNTWKNPTIVIDLERTSIICGDGSRIETSILNLAKDLASLPQSAWPLGRVVAFSRTGRTFPFIPLRGAPAPKPISDPRVTEVDNRAGEVLKILKSLDLEIVETPIN